MLSSKPASSEDALQADWVPSQGCASPAVSGLGTAASVPGQKVTPCASMAGVIIYRNNRHFFLQTSPSHQLQFPL